MTTLETAVRIAFEGRPGDPNLDINLLAEIAERSSDGTAGAFVLPMSRDDTGSRQLARLKGLRVGMLRELTDVDTYGTTYAVAVVQGGRLLLERYGGELPHFDRPPEPVHRPLRRGPGEKLGRQPRFANARFAAEQHHLPAPILDLRPALQEHGHFSISPHKGSQSRGRYDI